MVTLLPFLTARLGQKRLLAHPGGRDVYLLNPVSTWVWEAFAAGLNEQTIADALAEHFKLSPDQALADVQKMAVEWQKDLSFHTEKSEKSATISPLPYVEQTSANHYYLRIADQTIHLLVTDSCIAQHLAPLVTHLQLSTTSNSTCVIQTGQTTDWTVSSQALGQIHGDGQDRALVEILNHLIEQACQTPQRLLVAHAAGIAYANKSWLLIGRGGTGKTTLAAALNAAGYVLLSDDVVPVNLDGMQLGLGLPLCIKSGSWSVLSSRIPILTRLPVHSRYGEPVKFLPPQGAVTFDPFPLGGLIAPHYQPGKPMKIESLSAEEMLQRLIEAEAILPPLTQERLTALASWISSAPAFALSYPDLETGLQEIVAIMEQHA